MLEEDKREYLKKWYIKNRNRILEKQKRYYHSHRQERMAHNNAAFKERYYRLKAIVFDHYGNRCQWDNCTIDDPDMLQIDHVNGNGHEDRKRGLTTNKLYEFLINNGFPDGYRLLCANHNQKHKMNLFREKVRLQRGTI